MRPLKGTTAALAAAALLLSAATAARADETADRAAIAALWDAYEAAVVGADAAAYLSLWDAEGIQMPPGIPMRGKDVLDEAIPARMKPGSVSTMEIEPREIVVMGDMAYAMGTYTSDRKAPDGSDVSLDGKFLTILKRQDGGGWAIYRDIFNSNE